MQEYMGRLRVCGGDGVGGDGGGGGVMGVGGMMVVGCTHTFVCTHTHWYMYTHTMVYTYIHTLVYAHVCPPVHPLCIHTLHTSSYTCTPLYLTLPHKGALTTLWTSAQLTKGGGAAGTRSTGSMVKITCLPIARTTSVHSRYEGEGVSMGGCVVGGCDDGYVYVGYRKL